MVKAEIKVAISSPNASRHPHNIMHTTLPINLIDVPFIIIIIIFNKLTIIKF